MLPIGDVGITSSFSSVGSCCSESSCSISNVGEVAVVSVFSKEGRLSNAETKDVGGGDDVSEEGIGDEGVVGGEYGGVGDDEDFTGG
jgi:hypothetical protein